MITNHFGTARVSPRKTFDFEWLTPPDNPVLQAGEAHVWLVSTDHDDAHQSRETLAADELERADRIRLPQHRDQFLAARFVLRTLGAKYLGTDAREIGFEYNPHGKPAFHSHFDSDLKFNLSRRRGLVLIGFAKGMEIGVDLEYIDDAPVEENLAARIMNAAELFTFRELAPPARGGFFYRCWTRKEAYLKLLGTGLTIDPREIEAFENHDAAFFITPPVPRFETAIAVCPRINAKLR